MTTPPCATLINPMARHLKAIGGPIRIAHAEGVHLYDDTGRSWIDCETGTGLFSLGHRDAFAHVTLMDSLERFDLGNHHLISTERAELADTVLLNFMTHELYDAQRAIHDPRYEGKGENIPDGDAPAKFVFNVSSGECVDSAIKLARGATGKNTIICADNSYHGSTGYALAASAPELSEKLPGRLPQFVHVSYASLDAIQNALASNNDVAAIILEPIAVEAGCVVPPWNYLRDVYRTCKKNSVLLILDESVTGLGRTGYAYQWSAASAYPDILIVGRAMGSGIYPLYATCHTEKLDRFYVRNPFVHVSTFGGGEVGCNVAWPAVHELTKEELLNSVQQLGAEFRTAIGNAQSGRESLLVEVRGIGLLNAVAFRDADIAASMQHALYDRGVFCRPALLAPECLLFIPPLTITDEENRSVISAFTEAFAFVVESAS